jgi:hypothetical protein
MLGFVCYGNTIENFWENSTNISKCKMYQTLIFLVKILARGGSIPKERKASYPELHPPSSDLWSHLPTELLTEVFCFLKCKSVARASKVCKSWRKAMNPNVEAVVVAKYEVYFYPDVGFVPSLKRDLGTVFERLTNIRKESSKRTWLFLNGSHPAVPKKLGDLYEYLGQQNHALKYLYS